MMRERMWMLALGLLAGAVLAGAVSGAWRTRMRWMLRLPFLGLLLAFPMERAWRAWAPPTPDGRGAAWWEAWILFWACLVLGHGAERLWNAILQRRGRPADLPPLLASILRGLFVLAVALLVLKHRLGLNITPVVASTALATAVIGFALQGVLGNLMAGLSLNLVRSYRQGDWIAVRNVEGQVVHSDWRETRLRTTSLQLIVVPNSLLASELVTNFTQSDPLRRHELFAVTAPEAPPGRVVEALQAAAADVPGVLAEPAPEAHVVEYREFFVRYRLFFHSRDYARRSRIEGRVMDRVWYEFRRRAIPSPSMGLLTPGEADRPAALAPARTGDAGRVSAQERAASLLEGEFGRLFLRDEGGAPWVTVDELLPVVARMFHRVYGPGEVICRQGEAGTSCGVLLEGRLDGVIHAPEHGAGPAGTTTFTIEGGAVFGEMSLLTGQPRMATLRAAGHAEVLEIPESAFRLLLGLKPEIPARLARLAGERASRNEAALREQAGRQTAPPAEVERTLLARFRRLLGKG